MPDVPSFPEAGQAKFPIGPWFGLVGPAGLPPKIVARMNKEMVATLGKPAVKELMLRQGFMARSSTPEELKRLLETDDGEAADFMIDSRSQLAGVLTAAEIETLSELVGDFNFESALKCLSSITDRLSLNLK